MPETAFQIIAVGYTLALQIINSTTLGIGVHRAYACTYLKTTLSKCNKE